MTTDLRIRLERAREGLREEVCSGPHHPDFPGEQRLASACANYLSVFWEMERGRDGKSGRGGKGG